MNVNSDYLCTDDINSDPEIIGCGPEAHGKQYRNSEDEGVSRLIGMSPTR